MAKCLHPMENLMHVPLRRMNVQTGRQISYKCLMYLSTFPPPYSQLSFLKHFFTAWHMLGITPVGYRTRQVSFDSIVPELAYIFAVKRSPLGSFISFNL